jgi:predicted nucleic acid-binding Zn ribbon protein
VSARDRKKRAPKKLGDVMADVLSRSGIADRVAQANVIPEWRALVGPQIANVTEPLSVTPQGTLFVAVTTNAWMTELSLMEPDLLRRLNQRTGRLSIKKIRWQIQRV